MASFFVITLATNIICTGRLDRYPVTCFVLTLPSVLISYRIWSVDRAAGKYRHTASTLKPVLIVVIESGAIYSTTLITLLAVYLSHNWAHFIVLDLVSLFWFAPSLLAANFVAPAHSYHRKPTYTPYIMSFIDRGY